LVFALRPINQDLVQPFLIDAGAIRGRLVRLGPALDAILGGHGYPDAVAARLAETLTLAAALAGSLKYDGIFTLQVQGDGAIPLVVADVTSGGDLRGYARFDTAKLAAAEADFGPVVPRYFGTGYLAFTVDQGPDTDRYQGIVALTGDSLADCADAYFQQSEQLDTGFKLALRLPQGEAGWQASAVMIQRMPLGPQSPILIADEAEEVWRRATILLDSARDDEMLDQSLEGGKLLFRLYHADGLQLHDGRALQARCRCSGERVAQTLASFPRDEVDEMKDDSGKVVVVCEFCKTNYVFGDAELDQLYQGESPS
jgi:molecular chaperone Hsp33